VHGFLGHGERSSGSSEAILQVDLQRAQLFAACD
jgi:hypothetical protein